MSRKQLIEQQSEYSRAKQWSILSTHKNEEQTVDIIISAGYIHSSRIFSPFSHSVLISKKKSFKRLSTRNTEILKILVNNDDMLVDDKFERLLETSFHLQDSSIPFLP